jgi:hypothetical protein
LSLAVNSMIRYFSLSANSIFGNIWSPKTLDDDPAALLLESNVLTLASGDPAEEETDQAWLGYISE